MSDIRVFSAANDAKGANVEKLRFTFALFASFAANALLFSVQRLDI